MARKIIIVSMLADMEIGTSFNVWGYRFVRKVPGWSLVGLNVNGMSISNKPTDAINNSVCCPKTVLLSETRSGTQPRTKNTSVGIIFGT